MRTFRKYNYPFNMAKTGVSKFLMLFFLTGMGQLFGACENMEDTYKDYQIVRIYSPKVNGLSAISAFKTVTLNWTNPEGDIAKKIYITYGDASMTIDEMVETATIDDLEIKGYDVSVYTLDAKGNLSVPATVYVFPNGED